MAAKFETAAKSKMNIKSNVCPVLNNPANPKLQPMPNKLPAPRERAQLRFDPFIVQVISKLVNCVFLGFCGIVCFQN